MVVAPDFGRAGSAVRLAAQLGLPVASADKTRISDTEVRISASIDRQVQGYRRVITYMRDRDRRFTLSCPSG